MSCLIVDELQPGTVIKQRFRILKDTDVAVVRFAFYKHNNPFGELNLSIYQDGALVATAVPVTSAEIADVFPLPYAYGLVSFKFDNYLTLHLKNGQEKTEYEFRLEATGGTNIAWFGTYRKYEEQIYQSYDADGDPSIVFDQAINDMIEPYYYEIYEYKHV